MQLRIILFLSILTLFSSPYKGSADMVPKCDLDVSVDIASSRISGISRISVKSGQEIYIKRGNLSIKSVKVNKESIRVDKRDRSIRIVPHRDGFVYIKYSGTFKKGASRGENYGVVGSVISKDGVSLTGIWYPQLNGLCSHNLKVSLPVGYEAVSEAEEITKTKRDNRTEFLFSFPHPLDNINLSASRHFKIIKDNYRSIELEAYFFESDLDLAKTYIEFTKRYLEMYEDMIGEYPYKRFSIVENFLPSGYSMPTFTLLGRSIVALPFIVETSLGHEILHQWFGNSVYIDYESGNWAEGLTSYLADHFYREQKGEGWEYRKEILINYKSYVTPLKEFPLAEFSGRVDRSSMAIGYGKVAMVFHMLRKMADDSLFFRALKDFNKTNQYKKASWEDIRKSFEKGYKRDLEWFFSQWIQGTGLPEFEIKNPAVKRVGSEFELGFSISQKERIYDLYVPVSIYLETDVIKRTFNIHKKTAEFSVLLPSRPVSMIIDEDYDMARNLVDREYPAVIARLIEDDELIVVLPQEKKKIYKTVAKGFKERGAIIKSIKDIEDADIKQSSFIVLDSSNFLVRRLYGKVKIPDDGFNMVVKANPWNEQKVVGIVNTGSHSEADAAFNKIFHYGKYSQLQFERGKNKVKEIESTDRGIIVQLGEGVDAVDVSQVKSLADVIEGVADKKIVYVGEVHDVFAHHAIQLDVISGLHKRNRKIAIGMEMFQRPFQSVLDRFIYGKMGEREFLKESEYFKRWGFDYNLYKPILDFARTERVPVIAMNLEREIIERVSSDGIDSLSEQENQKIPEGLDFSDRDYRNRLKEIFSLHTHREEKNFDYFYQSQILWDETMSQSINEFIKGNPEYQMAVLAGQGHLMYGSGIPLRTHRRNGLEFAIVLIDAEVEKGIADYVVFPKPVEGITTPKLMIFLQEKEGRYEITGFPDHSVSEMAGIKVGDIILNVDEVPVSSIEDIKIHLLYKQHGDKVTVRVLRTENGKEEEKEIEVEL